MPRRSGTPEVEIRKPAPARWLEHVGAAPAQAGVRRDADRLVDHHDVVVVVHDPDAGAPARGTHRCGAGRSSSSTSSIAPARTRSDLLTEAAVHQHATGADQFRDPTAGQPEHPGHRGVDPLAVQPVRHQHDLRVSHRATCFDHGHRPRFDAGRAVSLAVIADVLDHGQDHDHDRGGGDAHVRHVEDRRSAAAARKSITWPRSTPGGRNSRSIRLPATPAHSSPRATAQPGWPILGTSLMITNAARRSPRSRTRR